MRDSSDLKNIDFLKDCNFSKIIRCDICNPKEIFLTKVDYIIHAASNASMKNISKRDSVFKLNCKLKVMDNFRKDNKHCVDFIKIDTEGSELLLLNGEKKILSEDKPIIFSEILRKWAKEFDYKANDILIFLRNYGYNCYKIRQTKLIAISKIDKKTIATNFIFLHSIKHKKEIKNFT